MPGVRVCGNSIHHTHQRSPHLVGNKWESAKRSGLRFLRSIRKSQQLQKQDLKSINCCLKSRQTFPLCRTDSEVEASDVQPKLHTKKISAMEPFIRCRHDASPHLCSTWEMFMLKLDKSKTIRQTDDEIYDHLIIMSVWLRPPP